MVNVKIQEIKEGKSLKVKQKSDFFGALKDIDSFNEEDRMEDRI